MKSKTYLCRSHCATEHVLAISVLRVVTPKGELLPALCHASATLGSLSASSRGHSPPTKINVTSKSPVGDISVVTLIRTDTTLDHSQKAEKVYVCVSKACFHQKTCAERAVLGLPCHTDHISYGAVVRRTNFHRETRRPCRCDENCSNIAS